MWCHWKVWLLQRKSQCLSLPLPTTAGTAAEVTINYVITDEENHKKMVCVDPNDIPAIAIVDAELMYTCCLKG